MKYRSLKFWCTICYMFLLFAAFGIWNKETWETFGLSGEAEETAMEETELKETTVEKMKIALTFDDGPNPSWTPVLLDGLKERGVHVTFFVIGVNVEKYPELVKREHEEGHIVGNHTYNHVEITRIDEKKAKEEIEKTSKAVEQITGFPTEFMRPPFGAWQKDLEMEMQVMPVLWDVDPLDWTTENEDEIVNKVVTDVHENDIILLHDCYKSSVNAALRIIDILRKEGYEFVTVNEMIFD